VGQGASGALALLLFWLAFLGFFVAFHPGGLELNGHKAQNPRDVFLWLMQRVTEGPTPQPASETT
jgi:hypothetical protein